MRRTLLFAAAAIGLSGCQTIRYDLGGEPRLPLAAPDAPVVRSVITGDYSHYLFWGLAPVAATNVNAEILPHLGPGESVGEVRVHEVNNFLCGLAAYFTYGLYRPRAVRIEASVCKGAMR